VKPISTTLFAAVDPGFMVHQVALLDAREALACRMLIAYTVDSSV
jgi:hypothetical protein